MKNKTDTPVAQHFNTSEHSLKISVLQAAPTAVVQRRLLEKLWIERIEESPQYRLLNRDEGLDIRTLWQYCTVLISELVRILITICQKSSKSDSSPSWNAVTIFFSTPLTVDVSRFTVLFIPHLRRSSLHLPFTFSHCQYKFTRDTLAPSVFSLTPITPIVSHNNPVPTPALQSNRRLKKPLRERNVSQQSQFPVFVWLSE